MGILSILTYDDVVDTDIPGISCLCEIITKGKLNYFCKCYEY